MTSIKKAYLSSEDITDYDFYTKYFGGYKHWLRLLDCKPFVEHLTEWQEERDARLVSQLSKVVVKEALDPSSRNSYGAAKILLDRINTKIPNKVGRPSKNKNNTDPQNDLKDYLDDLKRLDLQKSVASDIGEDVKQDSEG